MEPLKITEDVLRAKTTEKVYQRGVDYYYEDGNVLSVVRRGALISAEVAGSEDEPYLIALALSVKGGVAEASCTCPYGEEWDGWCKHIIATLLFCLETPGEVEARPSLETRLAKLEASQLRRLLLTLAARHPRLIEDIEAHLP